MTILEEADALAGKDRSRDYGHPLDNHQRIADVWHMQLGTKLRELGPGATPAQIRAEAKTSIGGVSCASD